MYGLGAVLYAALTGRPPFAGATLSELLLATSEQAAVPPSQLRPAVPTALDLVCLRCLEKRPEDRFESAAALAIELQRLVRGASTLTEPGGAAVASRRGGPGGALLAAALVGASGLAAVALIALRQPAPRPTPAAGPVASKGDVRHALASAARLFDEGDLDGAEAALTRALALDPGSAQTWALRARARAPRDPTGAQRDCAEALARDARNGTALAVQGTLFWTRGRPDLARGLFDRAVDREPACDFAWMQLGRLAGTQGDWARAKEAGERVIALAPGNAVGWSVRGRARSGLGDAVGAEADLKQALQLAPESPEILDALADVVEASQPDRARVSRATAAWHRARLASRAGRTEEAEAELTRSLELFPLMPPSYLDRARLRLARGDAKGALADAEAGLAIAKNEPELTAVRDRARAALAAQPGG